MMRLELTDTAATLAAQHWKCGLSKLRYAVSVTDTPGFEDLV